jgi:1,2-phenylacetyl-CoA epoxidase catalytic subunit
MSRATPERLPKGFQEQVRRHLDRLETGSPEQKRLSERWNSQTLSLFQAQNQQAIQSAKRLGDKGSRQLANRYVREMLKGKK